MAKDDIRATALTLRFKHGRNTIFLFAEALTPMPSIKAQLLEVLHERYTNGLPTSTSPILTPLPDSIEDIILGVPVDVYEPSKGWEELDTSGGGLKETVLSLGLKDGSVIAFVLAGEGKGKGKGKGRRVEFWVEWSTYDDQALDEEMD